VLNLTIKEVEGVKNKNKEGKKEKKRRKGGNIYIWFDMNETKFK
jgi:hypothetical protein